jgi:hypothetical protein
VHLLSAVLLAGLVLNATLGWSWPDPIAGLGLALIDPNLPAPSFREELGQGLPSGSSYFFSWPRTSPAGHVGVCTLA